MSDKLAEFRERMVAFEQQKRELDKARKEAINDLLAQRRDVDRQLREMGYNDKEQGDDPSEPVSNVPRARTGKPATQSTCSICRGLPGHDGRAHRGQVIRAAFTLQELREKNLPTWAESGAKEPVAEENGRERKRRPGGFTKDQVTPRWD